MESASRGFYGGKTLENEARKGAKGTKQGRGQGQSVPAPSGGAVGAGPRPRERARATSLMEKLFFDSILESLWLSQVRTLKYNIFSEEKSQQVWGAQEGYKEKTWST